MTKRFTLPVFRILAIMGAALSVVLSPALALPLEGPKPVISETFFALNPLRYEEAITDFYADHNTVRLWSDHNHASGLIALLEEAGQHGITPARFDPPSLRLALQGAAADDDLQDLFRDQLLTDRAMDYARAVTGPNVDLADFGLDPAEWRTPLAPEVILRGLKAAPDPVAYLKGLALDTPLYRTLQEGLQDLDKPRAQRTRFHALVPIPLEGTLSPNERHDSVPALRNRLGLPPPEDPADARHYDPDLVERVIEFQRDHGLKADGIVGPQTLSFFNLSDDAIRQKIIVNLERLRWLPLTKPDRYIVVNIPAATLWAIDGGQVKHEMGVIVGRSERPTPQLRTSIKGVRFNPTWTVPPTIKIKDYWPQLQQDPHALLTKNIAIEIKQADGVFAPIDPASVDWGALSARDLAQFRFIQAPGAGNALGQIRVLMPSTQGVYLHDTNERTAFGRSDLAISSGCVRMANPRAIADFILSANKGWQDTRLDQYLSDPRTRDIIAENPFPVLFLYQTTWLHQDGTLILGYDVYGWDDPLYHALYSPAE